MIRYVTFTTLGGALGMALIAAGNVQQGIAIAVLGAFAGLLLATKGTSPARTLRLLAALIYAKNIPFAQDQAMQWVDEGSEPHGDDSGVGEQFLIWLVASHVTEPRRWLVIAGLIMGAITGGVIAVHDVSAVNSGGEGWMLPMSGCRDPLETQAVMAALAWIIWAGSMAGLVASAIFRRALILAVGLAAFMSGCIGYAVNDDGRASTFSMIVFFCTIPAAFALLWGTCMSFATNRADH